MATANIVDQIGSKVTVFTKDGNAAENRKLHTVDEFGIVISNQHGKRTFIPWIQVKYVDYADESNIPLWNDPLKQNGACLPVRVVRPVMSHLTTRHLTEELMLRTGVEAFVISPEGELTIDTGEEIHNRKGPATVLVNID